MQKRRMGTPFCLIFFANCQVSAFQIETEREYKSRWTIIRSIGSTIFVPDLIIASFLVLIPNRYPVYFNSTIRIFLHRNIRVRIKIFNNFN